MNFAIETVTIEHPDNPGEPMIVNKADFKPEEHRLFKPKKVKAVEPELEPDSETEDSEPEAEPEPKRRGRKRAAESE